MSRPTTNLARSFLETAARVPHRPCLFAAYSEAFERLDYQEVANRSRVFARHLRNLGVVPGDRVVLMAPNSLEFVCAYFGVWLAGGTVVPLDPGSRQAHVSHVYVDCGARFAIVAARILLLDPLVQQVPLSDINWHAAAEGDEPAPLSNPLALIIYTSGTTGTPKGVCLSHDNLDWTRSAIVSWAGVREDDRELTTLSLTHLFGLAHLHVYLTLGATMYIEEGVRNIPRLLEIIERESITSFPGTPAGFKTMVDRFPDALTAKASRLRYIVINSAPMPVEYTKKLLTLLPATRLYMYYGLTEASRSTHIAYRDHPTKLATVGRPSPGAFVAIGSPSGALIDQPGEILVKGPHVTSTYWGLDSSAFFEDGWFRTGDLGSIDADGFLTWMGRLREQINVDGLKLVPSEVEEVLREDARVKDCAVVGAPDPRTGESVVAFVVPEGSVDAGLDLQLRKLCAKVLEPYKVPRRVVFIDAIPKTDSGKVKRFLLQERLRADDSTKS